MSMPSKPASLAAAKRSAIGSSPSIVARQLSFTASPSGPNRHGTSAVDRLEDRLRHRDHLLALGEAERKGGPSADRLGEQVDLVLPEVSALDLDLLYLVPSIDG